jgi:hypothetical protein
MRKRFMRGLLVLSLAFAAFGAAQVHQAPPAAASEATSVTNYFAQFNDGNVGWYKIALEKRGADGWGRAKITVWCEPNTTPGGSKVACDAIDLYGASFNVAWQKSIPGTGWVTEEDVLDANAPGDIDYSPPLAGISAATIYDCQSSSSSQHRARVLDFRAASGDQWSGSYDRSTPTWSGTFTSC